MIRVCSPLKMNHAFRPHPLSSSNTVSCRSTNFLLNRQAVALCACLERKRGVKSAKYKTSLLCYSGEKRGVGRLRGSVGTRGVAKNHDWRRCLPLNVGESQDTILQPTEIGIPSFFSRMRKSHRGSPKIAQKTSLFPSYSYLLYSSDKRCCTVFRLIVLDHAAQEPISNQCMPSPLLAGEQMLVYGVTPPTNLQRG